MYLVYHPDEISSCNENPYAKPHQGWGPPRPPCKIQSEMKNDQTTGQTILIIAPEVLPRKPKKDKKNKEKLCTLKL